MSTDLPIQPTSIPITYRPQAGDEPPSTRATNSTKITRAAEPIERTEDPAVRLGGTQVTLLSQDRAVEVISARARRAQGTAPLAVVSANLDHLHKFGTGSRWQGVLEQAEAEGRVEILSLLDGMPLVHEAERLTGRGWPRLAGSDLIDPLLARAERTGLRVGFLGGSAATQAQLAQVLPQRLPHLDVTGWWSPEREALADPELSAKLAADVAEAEVDLLVVGLGKPRQELWIAEHGAATGAGALLAFGAVVDFLAGRVTRAPSWVARSGLEWSYRLVQEPRRLSGRYLVDGPEAYHALRRHSSTIQSRRTAPRFASLLPPSAEAEGGVSGRPAGTPTTDLTAIVVTYNNVAHVDRLIDDVRRSAGSLRCQVLVVDNGSSDGTVHRLESRADVTVLRAPGNLGYAGGINFALDRITNSRAVLVLNPDLALDPRALQSMWRRLWLDEVGAVAPRILAAADGRITRSLRFEPTALRTWGDALLGDRAPTRPTWATETDHDPEAYSHAHRVDWATGACLMLRSQTVQQTGAWDERYFLYSEEVDYLRRVRAAGWSVWFEPAAAVRHDEGGSGRSPELAALQAVNRVRYAEAVHGRGLSSTAVRGALLFGALVRLGREPHHRLTAARLLRRRTWSALPHAPDPRPTSRVPHQAVWGSVVVPAHQEEAVIAGTLSSLAPFAAVGTIELVVAANGCTDRTVSRAAAVDGATVLDLPASSKCHALNEADQVASSWPRLYLDADITISPTALGDLFTAFDDHHVLAARPSYRYDTAGAGWWVRRYYAARTRLPECRAHLWGAGAYAVSERGHARFDAFPALVADDLFVDALFSAKEMRVIDTEPVVVRTPRDVRSLLKVLRRTYGGVSQMEASEVKPPETTRQTLSELTASVRSPGTLVDALVYAGLTVVARTQSRFRTTNTWERDESTRRVTP